MLARLEVMAGKGLPKELVDDAYKLAESLDRTGAALDERVADAIKGAMQERYLTFRMTDAPRETYRLLVPLGASAAGRWMLQVIVRAILGLAWWQNMKLADRVGLVGLALRLNGWPRFPGSGRACQPKRLQGLDVRVLVTGTDGYIGCRLAPFLATRKHVVSGLDTGFYRDGWLYTDIEARGLPITTQRKDLRTLQARDFEDMEAVLHLAELSNDPLGENSPDVTYEINHRGSVRLAELAKAAGVRRFVYASSCSVYGVGSGEFLDETSAVNPQTAYARCKVLVERDLARLADERFCVVFLRNSTAYGPSPRMRFDIVLNDLCARAHTQRHIAHDE